MGGTREDVLQSSVPKAATAPSRRGGTTISGTQQIRIHEENRQVHFHDDTSKLKAAVPVDVWFKAWLDITATYNAFTYHDLDNKTVLTVAVTEDANGGIDASVQVEPADGQYGDTFQRLQKFTLGK